MLMVPPTWSLDEDTPTITVPETLQRGDGRGSGQGERIKCAYLTNVIANLLRVNRSLSATLGNGKAASIITNRPDMLDRVLTAATLCRSRALA